MSTRTRSRPAGKSYTDRLYERSAAPRRRQPTRPTARPVSALLTLTAEVGHLTAAVIEWPAAPVRGLCHVLVAAGLGLLTATLYFGHSRTETIVGIVVSLAIPATWVAGMPISLSLYRDFPLPAAIAVSTIEFAVAALLTASVYRAAGDRFGRAHAATARTRHPAPFLKQTMSHDGSGALEQPGQ